jgi:hypothetical protein
MAEDKLLKQARSVFITLCKALDNLEFNYERNEEDFYVKCGARGDDLPMEVRIKIIPERTLVTLNSVLPVTFSQEKITDAALAISVINYNILAGNFDLDISDGMVAYRMTNSYRESLLSADLFEYMIMVSFNTIDNYNDKLFMIAKGMLSIDDFIKGESN